MRRMLLPDDPRRTTTLRRATGATSPTALDAGVARNEAPWIAIGNQASHDLFSARMGCQVFNPVYGMDLAALCIRK
jgi:hypothetical protein